MDQYKLRRRDKFRRMGVNYIVESVNLGEVNLFAHKIGYHISIKLSDQKWWESAVAVGGSNG